MRILVISDIHANLPALEAVLEAAGNYDEVWCLGDLVGYGPNPNECIAKVRSLPNLTCILGNHDAAALKKIDINTFNPDARNAILWTQNQLTEESMQFLSNLPQRIIIGNVTLSHGSPRHPIWEYLLDNQTATINFGYFDTLYCFVGHTHLPVMYHLSENDRSASLIIPEANREFILPPRAIINPGSVGHPRDRDPRSAFAIFDDQENSWDFRRVPYDISAIQSQMKDFGFSERYILRLSAGW